MQKSVGIVLKNTAWDKIMTGAKDVAISDTCHTLLVNTSNSTCELDLFSSQVQSFVTHMKQAAFANVSSHLLLGSMASMTKKELHVSSF